MKCEIVVDDALQKNPKWEREKAQKLGIRFRVPPFIPCPAGTVVDDPNAWKLVMTGQAKPLDDECREASGYTEELWLKWNRGHKKIMSGRATGDPRYDVPAPKDDPDAELQADPEEEIEMAED